MICTACADAGAREAGMLKVENLGKEYESFKLKDVSFTLERGYIMGFIGSNGSGKTTTLKSILNLVRADTGRVTVMGKDMWENELELKQKIGFSLGPVNYYMRKKVSHVVNVYKSFYENWDENLYREYLQQFSLDENKRINELSAGMKVKLSLAMALSHGSELIIFDEPTSGLDPIARDELLDLFRGLVEDGERSILFSTHITSDLDKCADYILFIRRGEIVANDTKDDLIAAHVLVKGGKDELTAEIEKNLIGCKKGNYGFSGLLKRENLTADCDKLTKEMPNLEDIMVYYNREGK